MRILLATANAIDRLTDAVGNTAKWLAVVLVLVQFVVVGLRYIYGTSFIGMQESVIYVHATLFMTTIGFCLLYDAHVRVDVFYARWSDRGKALTDLVGIVIAVLPFCALVVWASWTYVATSWRLGEGPMSVGGLPFLPLLKSLIPTMAVLLAVQAVSIALRAVLVLAGQAPTHMPRSAGGHGAEP